MVQVFAGSNYFGIKHALDVYLEEFKAENGDLAVESFDGEETELSEIKAALQSVSLFSPQKLVVVKALSSNQEASSNIEQLLDATTDNSALILVETTPDRRSTYYKTLKKRASLTEFNEPDERELARWAVDYASQLGAKLTLANADYLIGLVGTVQIRVHNEIHKLADYSSDISRVNIDTLTVPSPQHTVFELLEAAFSGRLEKALSLYRLLRQSGNHPPIIISMFAWQMHQVCLVTYSGSRSVEEIASDTGSKPYPLKKSQAISNELGEANIKKLIKKLERLDYRLKTESIDSDEEVEAFIVEVATSF